MSPSGHSATPSVKIDVDRLHRRLAELARIGAIRDGLGVCRLALDDADRAARDLFVSWLRDAGLRVEIDRIGNVFGIASGACDGPAVMTGSHLDTVGTGGRFDGSLGVLAGLEVVQSILEAGVTPTHPLAVVSFTNEEGVRYMPDMMGSLAFAGRLPVDEAREIRGIDDSRLGDELDRIGFAGEVEPGSLAVRTFVELHIEQGPVLETTNDVIAAVEAVQGITWIEITALGKANHAGTTPVSMRHDAGLVAAEIARFARQLCHEIGGEQRATVGSLELSPNLVNVIPERAKLTVDLRNRDAERLRRAEEELRRFAAEIAASERCALAYRDLARVDPVEFDPEVVACVEEKAATLGFAAKRMTSGAGHDAQILAPTIPSAMIFIPSRSGVSHSPDEYSTPEHIEAGARVLAEVIGSLACGAD